MSTSPDYQTAYDSLEESLQAFLRVRYPDSQLMLNSYIVCFEAIDAENMDTTMFTTSHISGGPSSSPSKDIGMLSVEKACIEKVMVWGIGPED